MVRVFGMYRIPKAKSTEFSDLPGSSLLLSNRKNGTTFFTLLARPDSLSSQVTVNI